MICYTSPRLWQTRNSGVVLLDIFFLKRSCDLSDSSNQLERLCLKSSGGLRSAFQFAGGNLFGASAGGAEQMCCAGLVARLTILLDTQVNQVAPICLEQADVTTILCNFSSCSLLFLKSCRCTSSSPGSASSAFGAGAMPCCSHFVCALRQNLPILGLEEAVQPSAPQVEAATGACDSCGLQTQNHFGEVLRLGHCIRCSTTIILEKW